MAAVRFPKPEVVYLGRGLRYFIKIGLEVDFRLLRQVSLMEIA